MTQYFDIDKIIGIEIHPSRESDYKWLPRKQKTWFWGLFKRHSWYTEGFYSYGCYQECYESGVWDATPTRAETLIKNKYIIDEKMKVWHMPYVKVFLLSKCTVFQSFDKYSQAEEWVSTLVKASGKTFEIIKK